MHHKQSVVKAEVKYGIMAIEGIMGLKSQFQHFERKVIHVDFI